MKATFRSSNLIFACGALLLLLSGIWEFARLPTFVVKGIFFLIITTSVLALLMQKKLKLPTDHMVILGAISVLFGFSSATNSLPVVALSYFQIFSPIIIFVLAMSLLKSLDVSRMEGLFLGFVFLQILAALIKFAVIGQAEGGGIGTLSVQAGSVSTFIAFFICLVAMRQGALGNKLLAYLLLFAALLFSIINEKRLGLLVVTTMGLLVVITQDQRSYSFFYSSFVRMKGVLRMMLAFVLAIGLLILGARFLPTLTEGYSLLTLVPRVIAYLTHTATDGTPLGRIAGLFYVLGRLGAESGWLGGLGPMEFMQSNLTSATADASTFRATGFTILIARTGLAGVLIFSLFFRSLWRMSSFTMPIRLFIVYIFFDFLVYSDTLFVSHGVIFLFCLMLLRDRQLRYPNGTTAISA